MGSEKKRSHNFDHAYFNGLNSKIFFREGETKRTDTLAKQIRIHANNEFTFHSTLEHKNILPVFDFYRQQVDGVNYLVIVSQLCNMDFQQYLTFGLETFEIFLIRNRFSKFVQHIIANPEFLKFSDSQNIPN